MKKNKNLESITKDLDEQRKRNGGLTDEEMYQEVMSDIQAEENAMINDYCNR